MDRPARRAVLQRQFPRWQPGGKRAQLFLSQRPLPRTPAFSRFAQSAGISNDDIAARAAVPARIALPLPGRALSLHERARQDWVSPSAVFAFRAPSALG